jgi:hypothetical protein
MYSRYIIAQILVDFEQLIAKCKMQNANGKMEKHKKMMSDT